MTAPFKQHLIDPEICIRCYTCEMTCPEEAIEHDDMNVVVDPEKCNFCMDCIPVCPTGSIDEWRVVPARDQAYSLEDQYDWMELPIQAEISVEPTENGEAQDDAVDKLLAEAHSGTGGKPVAPVSAVKPVVNMYTIGKPAVLCVQGNYRLTNDPEHDVRHIILDTRGLPFPVLEGQTVGIIPPGKDDKGNAYLPRLYSVSSPRDGERPGYHNISLTVKRETGGVGSNYLCDLEIGAEVTVTGPFGSTFLLPNDPEAKLLMICTGTGSAPMRAFTMQRQRSGVANGNMTMFFGARSPDALPYFGPLKKVPERFLKKHLVFSRLKNTTKEYVQDRMREMTPEVGTLIADPQCHIFICGLRGMETGVDAALREIAHETGLDWTVWRDKMRSSGRYHVETY